MGNYFAMFAMLIRVVAMVIVEVIDDILLPVTAVDHMLFFGLVVYCTLKFGQWVLKPWGKTVGVRLREVTNSVEKLVDRVDKLGKEQFRLASQVQTLFCIYGVSQADQVNAAGSAMLAEVRDSLTQEIMDAENIRMTAQLILTNTKLADQVLTGQRENDRAIAERQKRELKARLKVARDNREALEKLNKIRAQEAEERVGDLMGAVQQSFTSRDGEHVANASRDQ